MPRYRYKAKRGPKEVVEGSIEADSEELVVNKLIDTGLYPVWVEGESQVGAKKAEDPRYFLRRVKIKDLSDFTRQLSELLDSGLALYEALNIVEKQIHSIYLRRTIGDIKAGIKDGKSFSDSLKAHPQIFSNLYINLVKSGEAGGMLNAVLANLSDFLEKQEDIRSRILTALSYPILMAVVGLVTIFILMGFVIPRLADMLLNMGEALPFPTRILIGFSDFVRSHWILLVVFIAGVALFIKRSSSNKFARRVLDGVKLKIPVFGALTKDIELARFSRTLSTLLGNGVPILNSLKITSSVINNELIREDINKAYDDVRAGLSLSSALRKSVNFPVYLVNMVAIGEEGGFLDKTLARAAKTYELDSDRAVKTFSSLLEPVMILSMGLIVGFIVMSMLLPVFQISLVAH